MAFHRSTQPTTSRVYRYGLLPPSSGANLVDEQMWLVHRYSNELVEIERARRKGFHAALAVVPEVAEALRVEEEALARYHVLRDSDSDDRAAEFRKKGKRRRKSSPAVADALAALKAATDAVEDVRAAAVKAIGRDSKKKKTAKKKKKKKTATELVKMTPAEVASVTEAINENDAVHGDAAKRKRAEFIAQGLYWGNYQVAEASIPRKGPPPKFRRWEGRGHIAVQIQGGMTYAELLGCNHTMARLEIRDDWGSNRRTSRHGLLWIRVGSKGKGGREPVWATFPVCWHRHLPEGARIKRIDVTRRIQGVRAVWAVCVTVQTPGASLTKQALVKPVTKALPKAVGLDVGWRSTDDGGIRVAVLYDGDRHYEVALPHWFAEGDRLVSDLQSIRRCRFNAVKDQLLAALREGKHKEQAETFATLASWDSQARLARAVREWEGCPAYLTEWRAKERHLYQWERDAKRYLVEWRKNWYCHWVAWISQRYKNVVIEKFDIAKIKKKAEAGEDKEEATGPHSLAAPGELRRILLSTCSREGVQVHLAPAGNTTRKCSVCGKLRRKKKGEGVALMQECPGCGRVMDQDANASRNLYGFASAGVIPETPVAFAVPEAAWYGRFSLTPKKIQSRVARLQAALETSPPDSDGKGG